MNQYKVTSTVIRLEQKIKSNTIVHDKGYTRIISWQKLEGNNDFFSQTEANQLKTYLDGKSNFSENRIVKITPEDSNPDIADLTIFAKDVADGRKSVDESILLEQCRDLSDYNLDFKIIGYLNPNDLT